MERSEGDGRAREESRGLDVVASERQWTHAGEGRCRTGQDGRSCLRESPSPARPRPFRWKGARAMAEHVKRVEVWMWWLQNGNGHMRARAAAELGKMGVDAFLAVPILKTAAN